MTLAKFECFAQLYIKVSIVANDTKVIAIDERLETESSR
jgi:hypothetical protein